MENDARSKYLEEQRMRARAAREINFTDEEILLLASNAQEGIMSDLSVV